MGLTLRILIVEFKSHYLSNLKKIVEGLFQNKRT